MRCDYHSLNHCILHGQTNKNLQPIFCTLTPDGDPASSFSIDPDRNRVDRRRIIQPHRYWAIDPFQARNGSLPRPHQILLVPQHPDPLPNHQAQQTVTSKVHELQHRIHSVAESRPKSTRSDCATRAICRIAPVPKLHPITS